MPIPVFAHVNAVSYLIPAATGVMRFSRSNRAMRTLAILCVLACFDVAAQLFLALKKEKNYFISDYYRVIEVTLLCAVFYFSLAPKGVRNILRGLGIVFFVIWVANTAWFNNYDQINNGMAMLSRIFVLVMSLMTLQATMKDESSPLLERAIFWIGLGAALYSSGTLLLLGLSNHLLQLGASYFLAAWHINWGLSIVANLFYTKGMLCKSQG